MPVTDPKPHNLSISRELAYTVILACTGMGLVGIVLAVLFLGIDAEKTVIVTAVLGILSLIVTNAVAGLKATEAADTASRNHVTTVFTASQNANVMQRLDNLEKHLTEQDVSHE